MATPKPDYMSQQAWDYLLKFTVAHEGKVLHMYNNRTSETAKQDVTCGIGILLIDRDTATGPDYKYMFFDPATKLGASDDQLRDALGAEYPAANIEPLLSPPPAYFTEWISSLNRYLEGNEPDLRFPVHVRATAFQMKVWKYLQSIPAGKVQSYKEVAEAIGQPKAARAVARACASNRVALAIPCHRVIRGTGNRGGYRWGIERKRTLIDCERKAVASR